MTTSGTFRQQTRATDPAVWIERFVIFDKIDPLTPIREIKFRRGVNIIWAVEQEDVADGVGPTEIAGHSAGKTTLCRLLRYCLGEERFGTDDAQRLIRGNLGSGYVGAHVWLGDTKWAIARPIGSGNRHYAAVGSSVEDLLQNRTHGNDFSQFLTAIEHALLSPLVIQQNPRTGLRVNWKHILAWCARDQEAHYENVWFWRSPRSNSEPLGLEKPKIDAVFLMRLLLGLVAGDEATALQQLSEKEAESASAINALNEAKREPEYWNRHLTSFLCDAFGRSLDTQLDDTELFEQSSLSALVNAFCKKEGGQIASMDIRLDEMQREAAVVRLDRQHVLRELKDCLQLLGQQQAGAEELQEGVAEAEQDDGECLTDIWTCPYSQKLVKDVECWSLYEARRRKRALPFSAAATELRDAEQLARRQQAVADLRKETGELTAQAEQLRTRLKQQADNRKLLRNQREDLSMRMDRYTQALAELRKWRAIIAGQQVHPRLVPLATSVAECDKAVETAKEKVRRLLTSHKAARQRLADLFDHVVKAVASHNYGGTVILQEEELRFEITRGPALGGEAVNILSVLLADVVAIVASIEGTGFHPRFLIHDSPREADLSRHIYWNLLGFLYELEAVSGENAGAPFQYIVTTTTPPPPKMREKPPVQERLNASEKDGMLFGRVLVAPDEAQLRL